MEQFFSRAAESAPEFIALIVLVVIFLRALWVIIKQFMEHSANQEKQFIASIEKKDEQFEKIAREMATFMESSTNKMHSAIERNTAVLEHVKIVIAKKETEANG